MTEERISRRRVLLAAGAGVGLLAGCTQGPSPADTESTDTTGTTTDQPTDSTPNPTTDTEGNPDAATDGPWPFFGANRGNTGHVASVRGPQQGSVLWEFDGGTPTMNCSPVVVHDTVYTGASGDPGGIYALDAATGEQRWGLEPEGYVTSAPAVVDGTLYVGTWGKQFYAIDATSGDVEWQTGIGHRFGSSSPVVANGTVFVGTYGDAPLVVSGPEDEDQFKAPALLALDADSGDELWRYDEFGERSSISSSPAYADGQIFFGAEPPDADSATLYAVDADEGTVDWERDRNGHQDASPAVRDGTVYYVGRPDSDQPRGRLYALDAATGDTTWTAPIDEISIRTSPAIADDTVYFAASTTSGCTLVGGQDSTCTPTSSGTLYAVDAESGQRRWTADVERDVRSSPAVTDGHVYVGCAGGITAVARDGTSDWRVEFDGYLDSSPAVGGGRLFVGCSDGKLYALGGE